MSKLQSHKSDMSGFSEILESSGHVRRSKKKFIISCAGLVVCKTFLFLSALLHTSESRK